MKQLHCLINDFCLSEKQGKAILEMRLQRLTGLEQEKIYAEMEEIKIRITYFRSIIENEAVLKARNC